MENNNLLSTTSLSNSISKFNGWTKSEQVSVLLSKLEGQALTAAAVLQDPSWDQLVAQLRENFSNEQQELASMKLHTKTQSPEETLESLSLEIQKLTLRAFPTTDAQTRDRLSRDSFINALSNSSLREKVRDRAPPTLKEALKEAKRLQTNMEMEQVRSKGPGAVKHSVKQISQTDSFHVHDNSDLASQVRRLESDLAKLKTARGGPKQSAKKQSRPTRTVGQKRVPVCWNCTIQGHTNKYCPFPQETIDQWVKEGLIPTPKSRQKPTAFTSKAFQGFRPPPQHAENAAGQSGHGLPTPP